MSTHTRVQTRRRYSPERTLNVVRRTRKVPAVLSSLLFLNLSLYALSDSYDTKRKRTLLSFEEKKSLTMNQKANVSKELNAKHRKVSLSL
jgi:hypothetical protein